MRLIRGIAAIAIGGAMLASTALAQDVPCAAYQNDAEWRKAFWRLPDAYTKRGDGVMLNSIDDAMSAFRHGTREAGMALLSEAAASTDVAGDPPLLAIVAGYMLRILQACPHLNYGETATTRPFTGAVPEHLSEPALPDGCRSGRSRELGAEAAGVPSESCGVR